MSVKKSSLCFGFELWKRKKSISKSKNRPEIKKSEKPDSLRRRFGTKIEPMEDSGQTNNFFPSLKIKAFSTTII